MQTTTWVIAAIAAVALAVGVIRAARRSRRTYVPARPVTISVTEPVEDVLESPRHAAEARAAERSGNRIAPPATRRSA
jgi:hypothetical protein